MARGQMIKAPSTIMYASVVTREIARTALMIPTLNDLEVQLGVPLNLLEHYMA